MCTAAYTPRFSHVSRSTHKGEARRNSALSSIIIKLHLRHENKSFCPPLFYSFYFFSGVAMCMSVFPALSSCTLLAFRGGGGGGGVVSYISNGTSHCQWSQFCLLGQTCSPPFVPSLSTLLWLWSISGICPWCVLMSRSLWRNTTSDSNMLSLYCFDIQ